MSVKNNLINVCRFCERHQAVVLKMTSPEAMDCKAKLELLKDELSGCFPRDWDIQYSSGNGNFPKVPYISFLPPGQKTSNGLYVVICFGKTGNGLVAGCAVSKTNKKTNSFLSSVQTVNRGHHPVIDVNGTRPTAKYNNCFVNPLEVLVDSIDEDALVSHLRQSASECIRMLGRNSSPEPPPETPINATPQSSFSMAALNDFKALIAEGGLIYSSQFVDRFVAALCAKPFVILSGLSGSGKTKLAQAFANWMSVPGLNNVKLIPVGADWTNNEHLLGYPNALDDKQYVMPDTGALKFMIEAQAHNDVPYFLILDEMNLSHVERYFADFLSAMESGEDIKLHGGDKRCAEGITILPTLKFPKNLYVIGTMNVDETTYMFSPKVLDRAQVIEFRIDKEAMKSYLSAPTEIDMAALAGEGAKYAKSFYAKRSSVPELAGDSATALRTALSDFFEPLAELGAEFGYRTAFEATKFVSYYCDMGATIVDAIDAALLQKLLPKLHGSQARLGPVREKLAALCDGKYPLSLDKIGRMQKRLEVGFTSFAEA